MHNITITEIVEPGWDFKYRIVDRRDGIEEKAYTRVGAGQVAVRLAARKI